MSHDNMGFPIESMNRLVDRYNNTHKCIDYAECDILYHIVSR